MKKVFIVIFSCFCLLTLVGCRSVSELTKANDELNGDNYTVYYQTHKNVTYGKKELLNESDEYLIKQNGNLKMVSTWDNAGNREDVYTELKNDTLDVYKSYGRYWAFDHTELAADYKDIVILPTVQINENNFSYEDKIWVGNKENINNELKGYFEELAEEYNSYKGFIDAKITSVVNNYDITLVNNSLSEIYFDYQVFITFVDGKVITISETVEAKYSDISSTVLAKPEGILDLSYALNPTDNYTANLYYSFEQILDGTGVGTGAQITLKQDGNKTLMIDPNSTATVYIEEVDGILYTYIYDGYEWHKMTSTPDELLEELNQMSSVPEIPFTAEYFELVDGVYQGKAYRMNMFLGDYMNELQEQFNQLIGSNKTECKVSFKEYNIQVVDNVISKIYVELEITCTTDLDTVYNFVQKTLIEFEDVNNTEITRPTL